MAFITTRLSVEVGYRVKRSGAEKYGCPHREDLSAKVTYTKESVRRPDLLLRDPRYISGRLFSEHFLIPTYSIALNNVILSGMALLFFMLRNDPVTQVHQLLTDTGLINMRILKAFVFGR